MKRAAAVFLAVLLLTGCSGPNREMERGLQLRTRLLSASGCCFDADITADYGDTLHTFSLHCEADGAGAIRFSVTKPASICGVEGRLDGDSGALTFGRTALYFPLLADEQLSPVLAPWLLIKTLRSGRITSAGSEQERAILSIDDSYADDALHLEITLDEADSPVTADILYRGRRILSLSVRNFQIE